MPDGTRRYYRIRIGKVSGYARYVKIVDENETTIAIIQEIFDNDGRVVAMHQKYPEDTGHQSFLESDEGDEA